MGDTIKLLAMDLGASSGRVMLGLYDGNTLRIEEIHRFANTLACWRAFVLGCFEALPRNEKRNPESL